MTKINEAIAAIEKLLESMSVIKSAQVRPSGDDVDVIKVWVDLGSSKLDPDAWAKNLEVELAKHAAPFRVQVRAETDV